MAAARDDQPSLTRVGIVGAGPAGLVFAKELLERGCEVTLFEQLATVGGVFAKTYDGTTMTTSNVLTQFSSHRSGEEASPKMWSAEEYCAYLRSFAERFDIARRIKFGTRVARIARNADGTFAFTITAVAPRPRMDDDITSPTTPACAEWDLTPVADSEETHVFDRVVLACGVNTRPSMATWPGMDCFEGTIRHTVGYKNAEPYAGKRVLLVGLGESGSDIALQVAEKAAATAVSSRSGPGSVTPRYLDQEPADLITNRAYYSLPDKLTERFWSNVFFWSYKQRAMLKDATTDGKWSLENYRRNALPTNRFGTKNTAFMVAQSLHGTTLHPDIKRFTRNGVEFIDGTSFKCDAVIVNTGYKGDFSFLKGCVDSDVLADFCDARKLFKHMFHPALGADVVLAGFARPAFGAIPPCAEMQARLYAAVVAGDVALPKGEDLDARIAKDRDWEMRRFAKDSPRLSALTDYLYYMEGIADLLDCSPKGEFLRRLKKTHPDIWRKVMYGPISAHAYRLRGDRSDFAAMEEHYTALPFSRFFSTGPGAAFVKVHTLVLNVLRATGHKLRGV